MPSIRLHELEDYLCKCEHDHIVNPHPMSDKRPYAISSSCSDIVCPCLWWRPMNNLEYVQYKINHESKSTRKRRRT